jgi:hypothetical protein
MSSPRVRGWPGDLAGISHGQFHLDSVFLSSGRRIGPDEAGTFDCVICGLEPRRELARELKRDLLSGLSKSTIIEKLRP